MKEIDFSKVDRDVLENYYNFIETILFLLDTSGNESPKRANIFTTNYDLLMEYTFERILNNHSKCYFNDGSRGFINRILSPQSYNLNISEMGYYNNYKREVPTVNLQKMHGSVSWSKKNEQINVSYQNNFEIIRDIPELESVDFIRDIVSKINNKDDLKDFNDKLTSISSVNKKAIEDFYEEYKRLAIINPDKWKFHDTVFEQHYYQVIRNFSYELEKPNTVLMVFAFSFADEHIEEIVKRSLSNPSLEIYIICFDENTKTQLVSKFSDAKNVFYYPKEFENKDGTTVCGDFAFFNKLLNGEFDE